MVEQGFMAWLGIGQQVYGQKPEMLPLHIHECVTDDVFYNGTSSAFPDLTTPSSAVVDSIMQESL